MRRIWLITGAAFVVSVVVDLLVGAGTPGLISAYGFVGCAAIVIVSKWLGSAFIQRPDRGGDGPDGAAVDGDRTWDGEDGGA